MRGTPQIADANDVRERNLRLVLNMVRAERAISRMDIARDTQLSRATITNLINELLPTGIITETGTVLSGVGRRPILLEFDYSARALLGVDIGATHLTVVAVNLEGHVLAIRREAINTLNQPDATIARIVTRLNEVIHESGYSKSKILGIGVSVSGPLEGDNLDRLSSVILPSWSGVDLRMEIANAMVLPVYLDNDANLGALAELWWGHGRSVENLAYIKVATGVGCGLILRGDIFRGAGGTAGEIGHTCMDTNGPLCRCGLRGCLEAMTGAQAIIAAVREQYNHHLPPALNHHPLTVSHIVQAAQAGDPVAVDVIMTVGRYLGIAMTNLINLVNPELIVLGGDLMQSGNLIMGELRRTVRERAFAKSNAEVTITTSRLGDDAIAIGAATLVLHHLIHVSDVPILQALGVEGGVMARGY